MDDSILDRLCREVGFGRKIIYNPTTGIVTTKLDLLAGYYAKLVNDLHTTQEVVDDVRNASLGEGASDGGRCR